MAVLSAATAIQLHVFFVDVRREQREIYSGVREWILFITGDHFNLQSYPLAYAVGMEFC